MAVVESIAVALFFKDGLKYSFFVDICFLSLNLLLKSSAILIQHRYEVLFVSE